MLSKHFSDSPQAADPVTRLSQADMNICAALVGKKPIAGPAHMLCRPPEPQSTMPAPASRTMRANEPLSRATQVLHEAMRALHQQDRAGRSPQPSQPADASSAEFPATSRPAIPDEISSWVRNVSVNARRRFVEARVRVASARPPTSA